MPQEFKDTVSFRLKPDLAPAEIGRTLDAVMKISGVFALQASLAEPGLYEVEMDKSGDHVTIGCQIRWIDGVQSTTITPREFHALTARAV